MINNPFSLTFGKEPKQLIKDIDQYEEIRDNFLFETPSNYSYLITGVRGTGKTVLLTRLANFFRKQKDWLVVELNPELNMLEYLASAIYEEIKFKYKFLNKELNFSFSGISFSLSGEKPITNIITLLDHMFDVLKKQNKKVLICIDDVANNNFVKTFVQQYQIFLRKEYSVFMLMTGLFENVRDLQNEKTLTFLYRAPRVNISPLDLIDIAESFEKILDVEKKDAIEMAKLTNGYAFAYQALGYIMFKNNKQKLDDLVIKELDKYLRDYVYEKVYNDLSAKEKEFVNALADSPSGEISFVMNQLKMNKQNISQYRDKLLKKGIVIKKEWGKLNFTLPRFKEYVNILKDFDF